MKQKDNRKTIFSDDCFYDYPYRLNDVIYYKHLHGSARDLVALTGMPFHTVVRYFQKLGVKLLANTIISEEQFLDFCACFDYHLVAKTVITPQNLLAKFRLQSPQSKKITRQPVITIMGHVNHGKTTLIDYIRKSRVAEKEDGSITQKFGFYDVEVNGQRLTILDTPGHEAFVHLRSQGVKITDIVVIVIAANDGVQNQTIEAISLAQESQCQIIIALNKIDLPNINKAKIIKQLAQHNILVQGALRNSPLVEICARSGKNVGMLLKEIAKEAGKLNLRATNVHYPHGVVIETGFDKFMGTYATVFVIDGLLKQGDCLIFENEAHVVRFIENHLRKHIPQATASQIVRLFNFQQPIVVGSKFIGVHDLKLCKKIVNMIRDGKKAQVSPTATTAKDREWGKAFLESEESVVVIKPFEIILIAENYGLIKAIEKMLEGFLKAKPPLKIIQKSIGQITKENIISAHISKATIYSFNCIANKNALGLIKQYHVKVKYFNIIYSLVEDIEEYMLLQIDPISKYKQIGKLIIQQMFQITKVGKIAGCRVQDGRIHNTAFLKVMRNNNLIHEGQISELKQYKQNVKVVGAPNECGVNIAGFSNMQVNDEILVFEK